MSLVAAPQQFGSIGTGGIPVIVPNGKLLEIYFTITASNAPNNYPAGGDTLDLTAILNNLQGFMFTTSALPVQVYLQSQSSAGFSGYDYYYRPGTSLKNGKVQALVSGGAGGAKQELAAGNYPAAILNDTIVGLAVLAIE